MVTPSKVAAILGVSRFTSPYRLWHQMKELVAPEPEKEIFHLGHDFEPAMANIWKRENPGWKLSPDEVQIVSGAERFGFPAAVTMDRRAARGRARRVVEFKTARDLTEWGDLFTDQAPVDYVAQVTAQMLFSGYTRYPAHLMVLGPYFQAHTYVIGFDAGLADAIQSECRRFFESLESDTPPPLDDTVATYQTVRELHPDIDAGRVVQVDHESAWRLLQFDEDLKANDRVLRAAKAALLDLMGDAQTAMCGDIKIADRRPHARGGVALALATKNLDQLVNNEKGMSA